MKHSSQLAMCVLHHSLFHTLVSSLIQRLPLCNCVHSTCDLFDLNFPRWQESWWSAVHAAIWDPHIVHYLHVPAYAHRELCWGCVTSWLKALGSLYQHQVLHISHREKGISFPWKDISRNIHPALMAPRKTPDLLLFLPLQRPQEFIVPLTFSLGCLLTLSFSSFYWWILMGILIFCHQASLLYIPSGGKKKVGRYFSGPH